VPTASAVFGTGEGPVGRSDLGSLYDENSAPIDIAQSNTPESQMLFARLCALALQDSGHVAVSLRPSELHPFDTRMNRAISDLSSPSERGGDRNSLFQDDYAGIGSGNDLELEEALTGGGDDDDEVKAGGDRRSLKQLEKSKLGTSVYPSDYPAAEWEVAARRRLLLATSRYKYVSFLLASWRCKADLVLFASCLVRIRIPARGEYHACCWLMRKKRARSGSSTGMSRESSDTHGCH
jgi:hypothetical protein